MALKIIYEDSDVMIIDKPAGILVYPDKYTKSGTLIDELLKYYPKIKDVGEKHRPGIVHRLDRETSGLLVCAKNQKAYKYIVLQFQKNLVRKKYYVLVYGRVKEKRGIITYQIAKKGRKEKEKALTYYEVIKYFTLNKLRYPMHKPEFIQDPKKTFTLLNIEIKTGRMHQIRQHLKMLGYPVLGDREYTFKNLKLPYPISRLFLHAYYLRLKLPNDEIKEFKIKLPKDLEKYLEKMKPTLRQRPQGIWAVLDPISVGSADLNLDCPSSPPQRRRGVRANETKDRKIS